MYEIEVEIENEFATDEEYAAGGEFVYDIKQLAKQYILNFFNGKQMYCGGAIPRKILLTPRYLSLVLNSSIEETRPMIYCSLEKSFEQLDENSGLVAEDVRLVISVLKQCSKFGIPKEFSVGIMAIYLECCEGLELTWD